MALKITNWDCRKVFLVIFDVLLMIINLGLLILTLLMIINEYYCRSTLNLFFIPCLISIFNFIIDILMNIKNFQMKYAGHNSYGMLIRFIMFYCILTIMTYAHQRGKYIILTEVNNVISYLGAVDISILLLSMITSFMVIDVQSIKQMIVKIECKKNI